PDNSSLSLAARARSCSAGGICTLNGTTIILRQIPDERSWNRGSVFVPIITRALGNAEIGCLYLLSKFIRSPAVKDLMKDSPFRLISPASGSMLAELCKRVGELKPFTEHAKRNVRNITLADQSSQHGAKD